MFYILSKILGLFINPIIWIIALMAAGLLVKNKKLKHRFLLSSLVLALVFSNQFLLNEVLLHWEPTAVNTSKMQKQYDYGIILGGMVWYDSESERINFLQSSDRIWQGVKLYQKGYIEKIIIAGGAAGFFEKDTVESLILKQFLMDIGIPENDIITEEKSRNTYENAIYTKQILDTLPHKNLLLVTSAMHMPRARACFTHAGLSCDAFPTDHYSGSRRFNFDNLFIPNARTLFNWNAFIHELFGLVSYKISGYI